MSGADECCAATRYIMPAVMRAIIGDCPGLHATDIYGRCDTHCPDLPKLF
jgi:hypothetical protein